MHRIKIVGLVEARDPHLPVVGLFRPPALENHHRRGRVRPHQVRDIEAFDTVGRGLEPRQRVQLFDARSFTAFFQQREFGLEAGGGVSLGHSHQLQFVTTLRYPQFDTFARPLRQKRRPDLRIGLGGKQHQRRHQRHLRVVLSHKPF